jgi:hypothetical protein
LTRQLAHSTLTRPGVDANNIMMDGISPMDTGAQYGSSGGVQVTTVTKSGTNRFRGDFKAETYAMNNTMEGFKRVKRDQLARSWRPERNGHRRVRGACRFMQRGPIISSEFCDSWHVRGFIYELERAAFTPTQTVG